MGQKYSHHPLRQRGKQGPKNEQQRRAAGPEGTLDEAAKILEAVDTGVLEPLRPPTPPTPDTAPTPPTPDTAPTPPTPPRAPSRRSRLLAETGPLKKLLTPEQAKILAYRVQTYGDVDARNLLVEKNLGLARNAAKPYHGSVREDGGHRYEDVYHQAVLGIIRAAETYDPTQNTKFSTYATYWIRSFVQRYLDGLRDEEVPLVSVDLGEAAAYEIDPFTHKRRRRRLAVASLDAPVPTDAGVGSALGGEITTLGNTIAQGQGLWSNEAEDVDKEVEREKLIREVRSILNQVLIEDFSYRPGDRRREQVAKMAQAIVQRQILQPQDLEDSFSVIAEEAGFSREYARLIAKRIREAFRAKVLVAGSMWKAAPNPSGNGGPDKP